MFRRHVIRIGITLLTLFVMTSLLVACSAGESTQASTQVGGNKGKLAPMFNLQDLDGNTLALADFAGQKVYVKYWASWCSICLAGLDELDTLSSATNLDFKVISIVNPGHNGEHSRDDFVQWYDGLTTDHITVLLDVDGVWAKQFNVIGYPTSYFIGTDGVLVRALPGHQSNEQIMKTFQDIM